MQPGPERFPEAEHHASFHEYSRRYKLLLHAADAAARRSFSELLQELSRLLHELFEFNFLSYGLYDEASGAMRVYMLQSLRAPKGPVELPLRDSPVGWVWSEQAPLVISDLQGERRFQPVLQLYRSKDIRSLIVLPMTTARKRLGALTFGSTQTVHCDADALHFLERLASLVGLALENSMSAESAALGEALRGEQKHLRELANVRHQLTEASAATYDRLRKEREQLETIVEIHSALAASRQDFGEMFPVISRSLKKAIAHDASFITLWNQEERAFDLYATEPEEWGACLQPKRLKAEETLTAVVLQRAIEGQIVRRAELEAYSKSLPHLRIALKAGLVTWCTVPMRSSQSLIGVLYVGSKDEHAFDEHDLELVRHLAGALTFFIENARARTAVEIEKERLKLLLEVSRTITSSLDWKKLAQDLSTCVRRLTAQDYAHLALYEPGSEQMRFHALDFPEQRGSLVAETAVPVSQCPAGVAFRNREAKIFSHSELEQFESDFTRALLAEGIRTLCCIPLISRGRALGTLGVASVKANAFAAADFELLQQLTPQIAIALDNCRAYSEISYLKDKLTKEKVYLEQEIQDVLNLEEIIGNSPALAKVLEQAKTVAPSPATVLILGETGTGKELIARTIHKLSPRAGASFVKLNCAAIPTGLLESELFGHEKGAFTGAISQKVGRLELADKGTLFLDEVGEIPLELQPKLLRVLQDQEFERLGGTRTIRVNVRVLAATNRDLSKAVADHQYRADLFYRLHVFPVKLPALRERSEDIPLLVKYFVEKFARRMNKQIETILDETMRALERWHWPGNIRELENFIERSVILTEGRTLRVPVAELCAEIGPAALASTRGELANLPNATLEQLEREYIVQVLRLTGGVIAGSSGAAARLGMKRTTLQSKIQRLEIEREEYGC
jgi:formate hydrogenlyase transcriptional activator